ncbi:hypothetical protein PE067_08495 [Paracoccus sp. DMF-8]|uniref:phage late control D family protein n=1 Tax=Paracoccus sp. DMF-8 TaxID=3019445 RepID=UPI0023E8EBD6|nr:hypothetical protein [Paracoccus sp. DMF-8]MDF3606164.1 hypothetical protein [Paracoccus sp. DMF-8]
MAIVDRASRIAWPEEDARIEIALGFQGQPLHILGIFSVDGLSGTGPALTLRVTATAADMKGEIRAPKTRSWENVTLAQIVRDIAAAVDLRPVVGASIAATRWPWLAQTAESDLHFLSRIAATLDATARPAGGALLVQKRGEGQTAAGAPVGLVLGGRWPHRLSRGRGRMDGHRDGHHP